MTALGERLDTVIRLERGAGSRRLILSRVAVTVLALVALYDCHSTIARWFSPAGFIGVSIDGSTAIAFAGRFPDGRGGRATMFWELAAAGLCIICLLSFSYQSIPLFAARPMSDRPDIGIPFLPANVAVFIVLCVKLRRNRSNQRVLDESSPVMGSAS